MQTHADILSWSRSQGLFAGLALEGATLRQDLDDNATLYGRKLENRDIVTKGIAAPAAAGLKRAVERHDFGPLFSRALTLDETGGLPDGQWKAVDARLRLAPGGGVDARAVAPQTTTGPDPRLAALVLAAVMNHHVVQ